MHVNALILVASLFGAGGGEPIETLSSGGVELGGYAAPQLRLGSFGGGALGWGGLEAGISLFHVFSFGITAQRAFAFSGDTPNLWGVGAVLRGIPWSARLIHPVIGLSVDYCRDDRAASGHFILIEPQLLAQVNMTAWLRIGVGGTLMLVPDGGSNVVNPNFLLSVELGKF